MTIKIQQVKEKINIFKFWVLKNENKFEIEKGSLEPNLSSQNSGCTGWLWEEVLIL